MKILALGTCISLSVIRMLKMEAVFDNQKIIFDKLPWNFWDGSAELKGDNNLNEREKNFVSFLLKEIPKETLSGFDYVIIDLYALCKTIIRVTYAGLSKVAAVDLPYLDVLDSVDDLRYEKIELDEQFVYDSLEKFSYFLKEMYSENQIVVIRPKLAKRYLNENLNVCVASDLQEREKKEEISQ